MYKSVQKTKFYYIDKPGNKNVKWIHCLLVKGLKVRSEGHKTILRGIYYTGKCHKIAQYAAIIMNMKDYKSFSKRRRP